MTYTPGPAGRPVARCRRCRARRGAASASAITSSALSAPRSCARPISTEQHLGRGLSVGERAVAGTHGDVEALGDAREIEAREPPGQQAPRKRHRVEHAHADARAVEAHEGAIEHADVEGRVVRDEDAVARQREQLGDAPGAAGPAPARSRSRMPVSRLMRGGIGMPGSTRRESVPTCSPPSSRTAPISTMRAPAPTPVVSRSTTVQAASSSGVLGGGARPTRPTRPSSWRTSRASSCTTSSSTRRASSPGTLRQGEQRARRRARVRAARRSPRSVRPAGRPLPARAGAAPREAREEVVSGLSCEHMFA